MQRIVLYDSDSEGNFTIPITVVKAHVAFWQTHPEGILVTLSNGMSYWWNGHEQELQQVMDSV